MPSNHISNEPYHEWLREQAKKPKRVNNLTILTDKVFDVLVKASESIMDDTILTLPEQPCDGFADEVNDKLTNMRNEARELLVTILEINERSINS